MLSIQLTNVYVGIITNAFNWHLNVQTLHAFLTMLLTSTWTLFFFPFLFFRLGKPCFYTCLPCLLPESSLQSADVLPSQCQAIFQCCSLGQTLTYNRLVLRNLLIIVTIHMVTKLLRMRYQCALLCIEKTASRVEEHFEVYPYIVDLS